MCSVGLRWWQVRYPGQHRRQRHGTRQQGAVCGPPQRAVPADYQYLHGVWRRLLSLYRRHGADGLSQVGKDSGAEADSGRRSTSHPVAELFVHPAAFSWCRRLRLYRHAAAHERGWSGAVFEELIESVSTEWLIQNHYLAPYKYYGVQLADASKLHTKRGDYDKAEIEALMNKRAIFGSAVENWLQLAKGKQTIVYCSSIATSEGTAAAFREQGINAMHLDGTTPQAQRQAAVEGFRRGEVTVLCNVDLFGEGFDVPDCDCVVLMRPTKSLTLHIQQSMRSMRTNPNNPDKVALILDHVGNFTRHGLPDDVREWSLESKAKKKKQELSVKQCPNCFAVVKSAVTECPLCHYVWEKEEREGPEVVEDIILQEVARMPYSKHIECKSWAQLELFRSTHKRADGKVFKFAWSLHKAVQLGLAVPERYRSAAIRLLRQDEYRRLKFE